MSSTKQNIRRRNVAKKSSPKKSSPDVDQKTPPQGARHKLSRSNQWRSLFRGWGGAVRNACGVALALALALAAVFFAFVRDENRESVPQISGGDDFDALVVGAGLSGMVFADLLSRLKGLRVLVIEKRDHIGGNCYDEMDGDSGILMNRYGAHLFHTNNTMVWDYVHRFSEWEPFEHRVVGKVDKKLVPIPVNIETVNLLTESKVKSVAEMAQWLEDNQLKLDREPANSEEAAKQRVGARLFAKIFEEYTKKQWARPAQELNASVLQRIPVIETYDDRYFPADRFQALPSRGYTEWINTSFTNENITVQLDTDYFTSWHSKVRDGSAPFSKVFFTGPIDHFFEGDPDVDLDPLEYRSISFEREFIANTPFYQMAGQVNYPQFDDGNFTRIIEYKHFLKRTLKQALYPHTVIFKEFSTDDGEPYYPVADSRNQELFAKYNELAERWSKDRDGIVHFVGRLANYKYFNMDAAILNALTEYAKLYNVSMDELHREIKANSPSSTGSVPSNRCPFEISFALQTDGEQIPPKVQELCAHPFYQRHRERAQFQIYRTSPSAKSQDGYDWDSYQRFATKLKEMGCTLGPSDGTDLGIDPNRRFYDNLFVKTLPADGRESECWINHFVIAPLSDANVFLRGDIGADIGDIIEALSEMERSLWINSSWCGTRPNPKNFEDPNVLKHGFANFHFQSFSISKMHRNDDNGTLCELLRRIEPDRELSDAECSAAALSEGGEFVASNVAIVRMLQKHRTFLWEIYSRIRSQTNADSLALTLQMRRLWFPLFRGFEALTPSQPLQPNPFSPTSDDGVEHDPRRHDGPTPRCFVLHKTHKSNEALLTDRFLRAQSQVHLYRDCQYVLLFQIGNYTLNQLPEEESAALRDAQKALGDENVFVVSRESTEAAMPGIFEEFKRSNRDWLGKTWAWNMADIPEMVWAHHHLFGGPHAIDEDDQDVDIWVLEYDVVWSGHLGKLLIDDISSDLNQTYVAFDVATSNKWAHSFERYPSTLYQGTPIWRALILMVRYRPWILSRMIRQMQQKQYVYCEMRAMMLCVNGKELCSWGDLRHSHPQYFGYFTWRRVEPSMSKQIVAEIDANVTSRFFHPMK